MKRNIAVILALAPVFLLVSGAAWTYHQPIASVLVAIGYVGFLIAYARAPVAPPPQEGSNGDH